MSVEEIVVKWENSDDDMTFDEIDALIADWRKRGERIAELEREVLYLQPDDFG